MRKLATETVPQWTIEYEQDWYSGGKLHSTSHQTVQTISPTKEHRLRSHPHVRVIRVTAGVTEVSSYG